MSDENSVDVLMNEVGTGAHFSVFNIIRSETNKNAIISIDLVDENWTAYRLHRNNSASPVWAFDLSVIDPIDNLPRWFNVMYGGYIVASELMRIGNDDNFKPYENIIRYSDYLYEQYGITIKARAEELADCVQLLSRKVVYIR